ncbi:hypothetical protein BV394_14110 [Brevirhabdus pacifica]|uniref:Uncharacterized protein n=1 Tax=Brevirhabdus pacifica TaxID=1267768 RepID=A0A1U7DL10_9RHOB|nr:DUF924 family protein [Brevirhabdus pacifica]APX90707.1 hypothetical protein BV394_14110 [Brevirhabdus pacifica]OWU78319.1 membrane protein [Loktanella sp. 22II-4b]PJJ85137.1 uncharacterized protein (DUF924 family) [Brevirhabdus pacifica]
MQRPDQILSFWLDEIAPSDWYSSDSDLDARIRDRFLRTWEGAMEGSCGMWLTYPSGVLAYVILLDQFSRNMFRGDARAFSSDPLALAAAKVAIHKNWDRTIDEPARQFFYMPLMHRETIDDQERCVRLFCSRMPETGESNLLHARVHREIIRRFGRFPGRNEALGRRSSSEEKQFLDDHGYAELLQEMRERSAPQGVAAAG